MKKNIIAFALSLTFGVVFSQEKKDEKIEITTFNLSEIPKSLYGCSCIYANSKLEYQADKYMYFDDLGKNCLISIDSKIVSLEKEGDVFKNGKYTVFIENITETDEANNADLIIIDKKGNKKLYRVYGKCGC